MIRFIVFLILFLSILSIWDFFFKEISSDTSKVTRLTQYPSLLLACAYFEQRNLFENPQLKYDKQIQTLQRSSFIYDK